MWLPLQWPALQPAQRAQVDDRNIDQLTDQRVYPRHWKHFNSLVAARRVGGAAEANRFAARYRIAACFVGATFHGVSRSTADGFSALLRVTLAANALEASMGLLGKVSHQAEITDPETAGRIRACSGELLTTLIEHTSAQKQGGRPAERLRALRDGDSDELGCLARAIRNTLAHGILTSEGAGATRSKRVRELLGRLADLVLEQADLQFEEYVQTQPARGDAANDSGRTRKLPAPTR
jgi:hypothetical protein